MTIGLVSGRSVTNQNENPIWRWLRSSHATGKIVAFVFLANNFLTGFLLSSSELEQDPAIPIHLSDFLVGLCGAIMLLAQNPLMVRTDSGAFRLRHVIRAWFVASIAATIIPLGIERFVSGEPLKAVRIAGIPYGLESYFAQFAVFTILVAGVSEMRSASTKLAQARHKLQEIQRNLNSQLQRQRSEMQAQANSQIVPVLDEIQAAISKLSVSTQDIPAQAIPQLKSAIDDVVRPLGHELALDSNARIETKQPMVQSVSELRREIFRMSLKARWASKISLSSTFEPVLGTLVFLMFVMPSVGYLDSIQSALFVCIPAISAFAITSFGLRKICTGIELPYLIVYFIGLLLNGSMSLFFVAATFVFPSELTSEIVLGLTISVGMLLAISGYFGLVIARRFRFLELANDTNAQIGNSLSRIRHEILVTQRQLGRLIHGGVQARLQSAILRLARAPKITEALLAEVVADIDAARAQLERVEAPVSRTVGELLDNVIDFWNGICDVEVNITKELDEVVSQDSVTVQCLIEVIREAISNAVKHDSTREIKISLMFNDQNQVELVAEHESKGNNALINVGNGSGYGSQLYDELTTNWNLEQYQETIYMYATFSKTN